MRINVKPHVHGLSCPPDCYAAMADAHPVEPDHDEAIYDGLESTNSFLDVEDGY